MADGITVELETERFERFTRDLVKGMSGKGSERALRKTGLDLVDRLIKKTPVDTGRARGGWLPFTISEGGSTNVGGSDPDAVRQGIEEGDFELTRAPFVGPSLVIVNGVRYITVLEFGSSDQAPAGMLRISMRELAAQQKLTREMREQLKRTFRQANRRVRLGGRLPG